MAAVAKHATIAFAKALTASLTPDRGRDARGGGTEFSTNHSAAEVVDVAEATHVYVVVHDGTRVVLLTQRLDTGLPVPSHTVPHMRLSAAIGGRQAARHALQLLLGPLNESDVENVRLAASGLHLVIAN